MIKLHIYGCPAKKNVKCLDWSSCDYDLMIERDRMTIVGKTKPPCFPSGVERFGNHMTMHVTLWLQIKFLDDWKEWKGSEECFIEGGWKNPIFWTFNLKEGNQLLVNRKDSRKKQLFGVRNLVANRKAFVCSWQKYYVDDWFRTKYHDHN